jgi:hypothetical protein
VNERAPLSVKTLLTGDEQAGRGGGTTANSLLLATGLGLPEEGDPMAHVQGSIKNRRLLRWILWGPHGPLDPVRAGFGWIRHPFLFGVDVDALLRVFGIDPLPNDPTVGHGMLITLDGNDKSWLSPLPEGSFRHEACGLLNRTSAITLADKAILYIPKAPWATVPAVAIQGSNLIQLAGKFRSPRWGLPTCCSSRHAGPPARARASRQPSPSPSAATSGSTRRAHAAR